MTSSLRRILLPVLESSFGIRKLSAAPGVVTFLFADAKDVGSLECSKEHHMKATFNAI